jgi:hypothetical protein
MTSGGARVRSGFAPDMSALKRERDGKEWTKLPTECSRPVPTWPAAVENPTVAELGMWNEMWTMPQAHVWHADRVYQQVALYCRMFMEGQKPRASSQLRIIVRQYADQLLLTTPALHSSRYVITDSPEADLLDQARANVSAATGTEGAPRRGRPGSSARSRMQVVPDAPDAVQQTEGDNE